MRQQLAMMWRIAAGQRLRYGSAGLAIALATAFTFVVPLVGRATIDGAISRANDDGKPGGAGEAVAVADDNVQPIVDWMGGGDQVRDNLWIAALAILGLTALAGVFTYLKGRWSNAASERICQNLRDRLCDHLQRLPCAYHDKADTGDLVQRCTSDVETLRLFLSVQVVEIANALIILSVVIPMMLMLDVSMTLVSLSLVPLIVFFAVAFFVKVKHRFKAVDEAEGRMTTVLQENLTGIRVVRAFARQDFERDKFAKPTAEYRDRGFHLIRLLAWYWTTSDLFCLAQLVVALGMGAFWVSQGDMTVGTLYAFLAYLQLMLWPVRHMGRVLTDMGKATVAMGRMQEILSEQEEDAMGGWGKGYACPSDTTVDTGSAEPVARRAFATGTRPPDNRPRAREADALPASFAGRLSVRDLSFAYDGGRDVLSDVNLTVEPGTSLAILGPSGAGKSTLLYLMLRLYEFDRGVIELDGHDIRDLPRDVVRRQFGVVMQEPFLFSKSLGDNIRFGRSSAGDEQVTAAAEAACIHDAISAMTGGYETVIGERGVNLSGGQRQRVAIARALVKQPPVLVLDDALSAVDSRTEGLILEAVRRRKGRQTTVMVAHRLSAAMHADQIVVLDGGRIVQRGTHDDLTQVDGMYRDLWRIQSSLESERHREVETSAG